MTMFNHMSEASNVLQNCNHATCLLIFINLGLKLVCNLLTMVVSCDALFRVLVAQRILWAFVVFSRIYNF